ncbi:hypothetical protein J7K28_07815 [Candidatus Aerophobetes bacterium]|nr:hypothetical protein [Candidatus Aerophobetes bacterium]
MALEKAKRLCLERAGVYLESTTVIEKGICRELNCPHLKSFEKQLETLMEY